MLQKNITCKFSLECEYTGDKILEGKNERLSDVYFLFLISCFFKSAITLCVARP